MNDIVNGLKAALVEKDGIIDSQAAIIWDMSKELNVLKQTLRLRQMEITGLYARNWWQRLLNKVPEI